MTARATALAALFALVASAPAAAAPRVAYTTTRDRLRIEVHGLDTSCDPTAPTAVSIDLTLRNGSVGDTVTFGPTSCDEWSGYLQGRRWLLDLDPTAPRPRADLSIVGRQEGLRRFRFRVAVDGVDMDSGQITARTRYLRGRTIWEDEDDFVNVCIDETRTIRKKRGRLYCTVGGTTARTWRVNGKTIR